jgi:acetyltransferase-like isoleucine patch superfamily enzyme
MNPPRGEPYIYSISGRPVLPSWVQIGAHTYHGKLGVGAWAHTEKVVIGKYCSIGDETVIFTGGGHRTELASTYPFPLGHMRVSLRPPSTSVASDTPTHMLVSLRDAVEYLRMRSMLFVYQQGRNTTIGNDVWLGFRSMVLGGARVGDGAVIAAGSVVFQDVPPYAIVAGNPAQVIRYRFSKLVIERLLRIAWWNWPDEKVRDNIEWFLKPVREFVDRFDPQGAAAHG